MSIAAKCTCYKSIFCVGGEGCHNENPLNIFYPLNKTIMTDIQLDEKAENYAGMTLFINKNSVDKQDFYEYIAAESFKAGALSDAAKEYWCGKSSEEIKNLKEVIITLQQGFVEEINKLKQVPVSGVESLFLEYIDEARYEFSNYINSREFDNKLRTECENLLICFDQMKQRLNTQPQVPTVSPDDEK